LKGTEANQRITVFSLEALDPALGPQCDK
jgi:hypothetical protein